MVMNLGGYIVERVFEFPYIDVVVGNPHTEDVKISCPIYSMDTFDEIQDQGIILEFIKEEGGLKEAWEKVQAKVDAALGKESKPDLEKVD